FCNTPSIRSLKEKSRWVPPFWRRTHGFKQYCKLLDGPLMLVGAPGARGVRHLTRSNPTFAPRPLFGAPSIVIQGDKGTGRESTRAAHSLSETPPISWRESAPQK